MRIMVRDAYDTTKLCVIDSPFPSITVEQLKHEVSKQHPNQPEPQSQRLILAGRILRGNETINDDTLVVLSIKQSASNVSLNYQPSTPWLTLPASVSSSPIQTLNPASFSSFKGYQPVEAMAIASQIAPLPLAVPPPQPVVQPEPAAAVVDDRPAGIWRYVDLRLMLKLCVLFLVFGRTEDTSRQIGLIIAAIVAYLWQVGAFTRRDAQADAAGDEAAEAVARIRQARRQARGENRNGLAGLLANLGDEQEEDDFEDDLVAQREQLAQMNAQHRAELIRRNQYPPANSADGTVAPPISISRTEAAEKFIVGLFASLHPSWRCRELDQ